jgi:hypothetical protein
VKSSKICWAGHVAQIERQKMHKEFCALKSCQLEEREKDWGVTMNVRETGCEDGRWIELAQDRVQWRALVLMVLNFRVLLP